MTSPSHPGSVRFPREWAVAVDVAEAAGRVVLEVYATPFAVESKGRDGPVTEADKRANTLIVDRLREAFPGDGVVAEESSDVGDATRARCWWVDPLDGTREFVNRNGEFAVHVGLAVGGEAVLGVVHVPVEGVTYAGVVGEGAWLRGPDGAWKRLAVSSASDPVSSTLVVSRSHRVERNERLQRELGVGRIVEGGSVGRKCGILARGDADAYLHFGDRTSRWDSCAPEALVRAAGGDFTDLRGERIRYDDGVLLNGRGLFVTNGKLRPLLSDGVARIDAFVRARSGGR